MVIAVESTRELTLSVALALVFTIAAVAVVMWAVLRAGRLPAPMALVVALTLLSMAALIGFIFVHNESLLTIAATGVGALAGAVSQTFHSEIQRQNRDQESDDDDLGSL